MEEAPIITHINNKLQMMAIHFSVVFTHEAWSRPKISYSLYFVKMFEDWTLIVPTRTWSKIWRCRLITQRCGKRRRHKQRRQKGINPPNVIYVELLWIQIYETKSHNITFVTINVQSLKPKHLDIAQYLLNIDVDLCIVM